MKQTGVELIAAERARQIEAEGWTPDHDDQHDRDELANAAACYALPNERRDVAKWAHKQFARVPLHWPWAENWWKPTEYRVRELVKAGALIAAEIDRLQRANDQAA